ncbi:putative LTR copia-type gag-polypeptide, partial [Tanacetum coccineum]
IVCLLTVLVLFAFYLFLAIMVNSYAFSSTILINNLDAGNPLYMNPNDSTSTALILFNLFGTENYRIWASAMKLALQTSNKFAFVDGSCVKTAFLTSDVLFA